MADKKMDISSLSDAQQEQLHGLQEKFTEHLAQRQQQQEHEQQKQQQHEQNIYQQQIQHHSYDPSQVQAYDATHAYYYHQQHHYAYNQSGFPISYQQQMFHHESVPVHPVQSVQPEQPVGVSVLQNGTSQAVEGSGGEAQLQPQQNVYNPQNLSAHQQRQVTAAALAAIAANPALDPNAAAAVSALAQLTQYAGTMGAAERATAAMQLQQLLGSGEGFGPMMAQFFGPNPLVGQPPFIGGRGGRRGGGLFRGGNWGNGRGRGRGRGGKRRFSSDSSPSKALQPDHSAGDKVEVSEQKGPSVAEAEAETVPSASAPDSVMIGPQPGPSQVIWRCDLCNADCNSAEILEQHKNGKKHKKNMQKTGVTISVKPESQQVDKVERPADSAQPSEEKSIAGAKRKMTSGRGRKRPRTCEPPKPKVVIPVMCNLCNIKCDTQEVFNRHLAGKKHLSKVKRYEGRQAVYGPNAQALYPPNPSAQQPYYHPQVPQHFYGTQSLYPPYDQYMPPQAHDPAAAAPTGYYHPQNNTTVGTMPLNM